MVPWVGAPVVPMARLARQVQSGLPAGARLMGFSAAAVAVRRALRHAADWVDHAWRLIHEGPQTPLMCMVLGQIAPCVGRRVLSVR